MRHSVLRVLAIGIALTALGALPGSEAAAIPQDPLDLIEGALRAGDLEAALAESAGLAAINPLDAEAQALHGLALIRTGAFERAEQTLLLALGLNEACPEAHFGMGDLARGRNLLERSGYHLVEASRAGRYRAEALLLLSNVRADGGDYQAALNAAELAEQLAGELDPGDVLALRAAIAQYRAIGDEPCLLLPEAFQMTTADAVDAGGGLVLLSVEIGEAEDVKLLLDTSYKGTVLLSAGLASRLELETIAGTEQEMSGFEMSASLLESMRIGGLEIGRVPCQVADSGSFPGGADGVIGTGFLRRFNCALDLRDGSLRLTRGERSDLLLRTIKPPRVAARALLYLAPEPILLVSVNGGEHAPFLLDTSAERSQVDSDMPGGRQVDTIEFGGFQIDDVRFAPVDTAPLTRSVGQRISGVIGADLMKNYRVYLHFARAELILERYEQ